MAKRLKLRLVGSRDSTSVFDDLEKLRKESKSDSPPAFQGRSRTKLTETFARIPHARARELVPLSGVACALLIELDRLIFEGRGRNPVKLHERSCKAIGLSRFARTRALKQLESAGIITVERGRGSPPLVTHHWFSLS
jgi:hypothetical protein